MNVIVFVKGANKPVLYKVREFFILDGGVLQLIFEDNSRISYGTGQWREIRSGFELPQITPPTAEAPNAAE